MLWISAVSVLMAGALIKLGIALVMVNVLTFALAVTGGLLILLLVSTLWRSLRR